MQPALPHIRATTEEYLARHPEERKTLAGLLSLLDGADDPSSRSTLPGHVTCSAVVIDRERRVLHIGHKTTGKLLAPGGHVEEDRTLLAAALREVCEETGLHPGDLCLTPQFLDTPIDIDVHAIDANPAKGEPAHQHVDFRFPFYLVAELPPRLVLQDEEVSTAHWLPFAGVTSPTLRAKLLGAAAEGLSGRPEPVNASVLIDDGHGHYLLHLRDHVPDIAEPGAFALPGGGREAQDPTLKATLLRELGEEVPGLALTDLRPYCVEQAVSADGLAVPVQVYSGRWSGDPTMLDLREGILLHWFAPDVLDRLRMSPVARALVRRHAAEHQTNTATTELDETPRHSISQGPPVIGPPQQRGSALTPAAYGASRAQLWTGVSALFTNSAGRILLEQVDYREVCLLPGGGVEAGERPSAAISREVAEELGLLRTFPRVLAVDWVPPTLPGIPAAMRFPGEHVYVYDGGTLSEDDIARLVLPAREVSALVWASPHELKALMTPTDARRALAALNARSLPAGAVPLEDGHPVGKARAQLSPRRPDAAAP